MLTLLLLSIVGLFLWYYLVRPLNNFKKRGVKQTDPWPLFGDQGSIIFHLTSFADFAEKLYNKFPKHRYSGFYQFTTPILILRDPELIKQIAVKDFDYFTDHQSFSDTESEPIWSGNLFNLKGQKWRQMRATLSGSFTSSKMKHMFNLINEAAVNFVNYYKETDAPVEVEMKDICTRFTNDVIATSAFGIKVDSLREPNNTFYSMGKRFTNFSLAASLKFFLSQWYPAFFKFFKISIFDKNVFNFFCNVIRETIEARETKGIMRKDMINLLLEARRGVKNIETETIETGFATVEESRHDINNLKQIRHLTDDDIAAQALVFFFAGFDTVSTAMCFGFYELATNKPIQDKLRKTIQETHKENNGKLTYEALFKMKYLDMVVSEILRKWPPVVAMDRKCVKTYTIEPKFPEEGPVEIKPGELIWLPFQGLHRDPEYYPDPEKFDPERFSDENKELIKPYTYLPFGVGPRNCIGSRFALLEVKTLFYNLLLNFEIVPIKRTSIPLILKKGSPSNTAEGGFWLGLKRIKVD